MGKGGSFSGGRGSQFFFVRTNNSNWEILTNNFVTFKREDWVKDEKFLILLGFTKKIQFLAGGHKKTI